MNLCLKDSCFFLQGTKWKVLLRSTAGNPSNLEYLSEAFSDIHWPLLANVGGVEGVS